MTAEQRRSIFATIKAASLTDPGRDSALSQAQKLQKAKFRVLDSYRRLKNAFRGMQDQYIAVKGSNNYVGKYLKMLRMVDNVTSLERKYDYTLLMLPRPNRNETQEHFVNRILSNLEGRLDDRPPEPPCLQQQSGIRNLVGQTAKMAERAREAQIIDMLNQKSTDELRKEGVKLQNDMYNILRRYFGMRDVLQQLSRDFDASRNYPAVPRYTLLKRMIKRVIRHEVFMEVCCEEEE